MATLGPLMQMLSGTFGINSEPDGSAEVYENPSFRVVVGQSKSTNALLSKLVFGSYSYEHLADGTERFACGDDEFTVPSSAVTRKCMSPRPTTFGTPGQ